MTHRFYKKPRLPRKLKKAARHVDFNVCDMQQMQRIADRIKPDRLSPSREAVCQIQLDDIHMY